MSNITSYPVAGGYVVIYPLQGMDCILGYAATLHLYRYCECGRALEDEKRSVMNPGCSLFKSEEEAKESVKKYLGEKAKEDELRKNREEERLDSLISSLERIIEEREAELKNKPHDFAVSIQLRNSKAELEELKKKRGSK